MGSRHILFPVILKELAQVKKNKASRLVSHLPQKVNLNALGFPCKSGGCEKVRQPMDIGFGFQIVLGSSSSGRSVLGSDYTKPLFWFCIADDILIPVLG
jgi:hypothetical protein